MCIHVFFKFFFVSSVPVCFIPIVLNAPPPFCTADDERILILHLILHTPGFGRRGRRRQGQQRQRRRSERWWWRQWRLETSKHAVCSCAYTPRVRVHIWATHTSSHKLQYLITRSPSVINTHVEWTHATASPRHAILFRPHPTSGNAVYGGIEYDGCVAVCLQTTHHWQMRTPIHINSWGWTV